LAVDAVEPVTRGLEVVPVIGKAGPAVRTVAAKYLTDLRFSALEREESLKAIDGVPPPVKAKTGDGPVFFDGVEATINVEHNRLGNEQVLLERVELRQLSFDEGQDPYFSFARQGEDTIGAGFVEPMRFYVELEAQGPRPARRVLLQADGSKKTLIARSINFLDTEPAGIYAFAANDAPVVIKVRLTALDRGYYETCLCFYYRVASRELRLYASEPIRLYTDGY
jgi:hypothetical protein